jgi:hypothetical protein
MPFIFVMSPSSVAVAGGFFSVGRFLAPLEGPPSPPLDPGIPTASSTTPLRCRRNLPCWKTMRNVHGGPTNSFWMAVAKMPPGLPHGRSNGAGDEIKTSQIIMLRGTADCGLRSHFRPARAIPYRYCEKIPHENCVDQVTPLTPQFNRGSSYLRSHFRACVSAKLLFDRRGRRRK